MFANPFTTTQTFSALSTANNVTIQTTGSSNAAGIADTRLFSNSSNAWVDAGTSPTANTAYGLFIRGITTDITGGGTGLTYSAGPTAFTYTVSGTLNTGNYTVPAPSNAANFTLVGNPFAAPVNSSELTNGTGVSYYVYQIAVTGDGRTKAGAWKFWNWQPSFLKNSFGKEREKKRFWIISGSADSKTERFKNFAWDTRPIVGIVYAIF